MSCLSICRSLLSWCCFEEGVLILAQRGFLQLENVQGREARRIQLGEFSSDLGFLAWLASISRARISKAAPQRSNEWSTLFQLRCLNIALFTALSISPSLGLDRFSAFLRRRCEAG